MKKKDPNKYPPGLDAAKVRRIIEYYDNQSEEEGAEEILTAKAGKSVSWVEVPNELLPQVKKFLAKLRRSA